MAALLALQGPYWADQLTGIGTIFIVILSFLTLVIVSWTASFARSELEDQRQLLEDREKTRHGQLVTDLSRRWDEEPTQESIILYSTHGPTNVVGLIEKLFIQGSGLPADLVTYHKLLRWPSLIETIGTLHDEGAIGTGIVYKNWGAGIIAAWDSWQIPVDKLREIEGPDVYRYFEMLADAMRVERERRAEAS